MKIFLLLVTLLWSISTHAFPWFFGDDAAVLIPNKIQNTSSSGATIDFTGNDINLFTPSNSNQLFLDTTGVVGLGTNAPSSTLDVVGAIESNGASVSNSNQFVNGSLEDAPDFSLTNGTQTAETTNCLTGKCALLEPDGSGLIADKCFTSSQWEGLMAQVTCDVKSDTAGTEVCWYDGTTESNCFTLAVNEWQSVKIVEQVLTGASQCVRVKTASTTGDTFIDNCELSRLKVDGTTKVTNEQYQANDHAGFGSSASAIPYFTNVNKNTTGEIISVTNDSTDALKVTALKNALVSLTYCANGPLGNSSVVGVSLNASNVNAQLVSQADAEQLAYASNTPVTGEAFVFCSSVANYELKAGDILRPHGDGAVPTNNVSHLTVSAVHYEQKSVLSDATAEATFTDWESCTVDGSWVSNTTYSCLVKREGDYKTYKVKVATSGLPTATSLTVNLPTGDVIDTAKLNDTTVSIGFLGAGIITDISGSAYRANVFYNSTTAIEIRPLILGPNNYTVRSGSVSNTVPMTWTVDDFLDVTFSVPIVGLSTKPQIVGTFKPAVRAIKYQGTTGSVPDNGAVIDFPTVVFDEDSLVTTGTWVYTAPESGKYEVSAVVNLSTAHSWTAGQVAQLRVRTNAVTDGYLDYFEAQATQTTAVTLSGDTILNLAEGDEVDLFLFQNTGGAVNYNTDLAGSWVSIKRIDQAGRLSQEEPKKFQTKKLTADVVSTDGDITDLTFNNLTIGNCYRIGGMIFLFNTSTADNIAINFRSASSNGGTLYGSANFSAVSSEFEAQHPNTIFKAVSSDLYIYALSLNPTSVLGNDTLSETYIQLSEENCVETNQW